MMTRLVINEGTCSGCGQTSSSGKCTCKQQQKQTRNYRPEPLPYCDWDQIYNQDASQQNYHIPQNVLEPVSNSRDNSKPEPLGLPVWDDFYEAGQKPTSQPTSQPVVNRDKPTPLGLPQYDFGDNFCTGK